MSCEVIYIIYKINHLTLNHKIEHIINSLQTLFD